MNGIMKALRGRRGSYDRLIEAEDNATDVRPRPMARRRFSAAEYVIFIILGLTMLWAWNMFLAAGPYFQGRFKSAKSLLDNFQAAELSVSTVTNLVSTIILTKLQSQASYPKRIYFSLFVCLSTFVLLAISTKAFDNVPAQGYFVFLIFSIFASSLATGFMQNGTLAYASAYGRTEYLQAVMFGQAIAGVLPPLAQIATVLAISENRSNQQSSTSALAYFITAALVSCVGIASFSYLAIYHDPYTAEADDDNADWLAPESTVSPPEVALETAMNTTTVPLTTLAWKLRYPATAVFITFGVTMAFPVFTQQIISINPEPSPLFRKAAFIPLAFLIWNTGDLIGRALPLSKRISLASHPKILLALAIGRIAWIPLYLSCNIQPPEVEVQSLPILPTIKSDGFYLFAVQFLFGLTNGYIGSCCMMGAGACVAPAEKEACGSFMGLMLVFGLAVGSFCSFWFSS